jgi:hypothetical protein
MFGEQGSSQNIEKQQKWKKADNDAIFDALFQVVTLVNTYSCSW